jgi:hypothetical protein
MHMPHQGGGHAEWVTAQFTATLVASRPRQPWGDRDHSWRIFCNNLPTVNGFDFAGTILKDGRAAKNGTRRCSFAGELGEKRVAIFVASGFSQVEPSERKRPHMDGNAHESIASTQPNKFTPGI